MGAVRTMGRRRLEQLRRAQRKADEVYSWQGIRDYRMKHLVARVRELESALADPEGTIERAIQRGLNERYRNDMRQRELEHHASWDAEVVVHKMAAARWMRSCVLELVTDLPLRGAIMALPLEPEL